MSILWIVRLDCLIRRYVETPWQPHAHPEPANTPSTTAQVVRRDQRTYHVLVESPGAPATRSTSHFVAPCERHRRSARGVLQVCRRNPAGLTGLWWPRRRSARRLLQESRRITISTSWTARATRLWQQSPTTTTTTDPAPTLGPTSLPTPEPPLAPTSIPTHPMHALDHRARSPMSCGITWHGSCSPANRAGVGPRLRTSVREAALRVSLGSAHSRVWWDHHAARQAPRACSDVAVGSPGMVRAPANRVGVGSRLRPNVCADATMVLCRRSCHTRPQ